MTSPLRNSLFLDPGAHTYVHMLGVCVHARRHGVYADVQVALPGSARLAVCLRPPALSPGLLGGYYLLYL